MKCPKCGSENVTINMQEVGSKTQKKSNSMGHKLAHSAMRGTAVVFTLGLSNLLIPKKLEGKEKTKTTTPAVAIIGCP